MRIMLSLLAIFFVVGTCCAAETRGLTVVAKDQATGQQGEVKLYNKSYAVIIGIDKYANLPPDRQLSYAVRDAQGIEQILRKQFKFDKIVTLYNEQATRNRIVRLLTSELPKEMGSEDSLFIFWAGHGNQEQTPDGDIGYLIPYDGYLDDISSAVTMSEIRDTISRKIPAKHVFYAMDACYSGLLTTRAVDPKVRRDLGYLREITKERVRQVLTAGSKGQEVLDGGPKGHSVFTGRLIEVLEATGDFITANEIQAILKEKVYGDAKGRGFTQTPAFGALSGSGDFVFVPNLEQKVADNRTAMAELQRELKTLETREVEARTQEDAQKRRELEAQRLVAEAKLKAEQLKEQQLAREEQKRAEEDQDRQRLVKLNIEDEQKLVRLKIDVAKKRQQVQPAGNIDTIEEAVAEIKRLKAKIVEIEAAFEKELDLTREQVVRRYADKLKALEKQERDEFESISEFVEQIRKDKAKLSSQQEAELAVLTPQNAASAETAPLKDFIRKLAEKEFLVGAETIVVELGQYDADRQRFPVFMKSKSELVKLTINGAIPLPKDKAKTFKQQYQVGAIRPAVTLRAGGGEAVQVALANDADNQLLILNNGIFMIKSEHERIAGEQRENEGLIYTDQMSGLQWVRDGNLAGNVMNWEDAILWVGKLKYARFNNWRLPSRDELRAFVKRGGNSPMSFFNNNGFVNIQSGFYWSGTKGTFFLPIYSDSVDMSNGSFYGSPQINNYYVWPVRDGQ